ncbi:MAG: DksA/TraR family C4-type zinc finger protein [Pseudomonadota bacterium]
MAGGWTRDGAIQDQIDATVDDAVRRARAGLPEGVGREDCAECGETIAQARREALPGVRYCVRCQAELDERETVFSGYNRRGSKDSQLR